VIPREGVERLRYFTTVQWLSRTIVIPREGVESELGVARFGPGVTA